MTTTAQPKFARISSKSLRAKRSNLVVTTGLLRRSAPRNDFDGTLKLAVFIDFDHTITTRDVIDDILVQFSRNDEWKMLERLWQAGKIGTRECLRGQLKSVHVSQEALDAYLPGIELDPGFAGLVDFLREQGINVTVLSDNFDHIIKGILRHNGFSHLKVVANKIRFVNNTLRPSFPHQTRECPTCAHCKKHTMLANLDKGALSVYIGDGLSDVCPSRCADRVFAKDGLLAYCKKNHIACEPYKTLGDVHKYLMEGNSLPHLSS